MTGLCRDGFLAHTGRATDFLEEEKRENWEEHKCWIRRSDSSIAQKR